MNSQMRESHDFIQVERRVEDSSALDAFLGKVREFASQSVGNVTVGAMVQTELVVDNREDSSIHHEIVHIPVTSPLVEVYSSRNIKAILYRKSVPHSQSNKYNLTFTQTGYHSRKAANASRLNDIEDEYSHLWNHNLADCDRVVPFYNPGIGNELTLLPRADQLSSFIMQKQAIMSAQVMGEKYPRFAYPAGSFTPNIPFALLPENMKFDQQANFIKKVSQLLPIKLILTQVKSSSEGDF
ncbi:MAG: hypothetical protein NVSMB46_08130 [Candidatus Saccharimonadales bacterium]